MVKFSSFDIEVATVFGVFGVVPATPSVVCICIGLELSDLGISKSCSLICSFSILGADTILFLPLRVGGLGWSLEV